MSLGVLLAAGLEHRQEGDGGEVDGGDVSREYVRPVRKRFLGPELGGNVLGLVGNGRVGFGTRDAGVADEEVQVLFARGQLRDEGLERVFVCDVAGADSGNGDVSLVVWGGGSGGNSRDDLAVALLGTMLLGRVLENFESAAGDVHLGTVGSKGLGVHQADAGAAAGDEADPAIDAEELGGLEGVCVDHGGDCCVSGAARC